MNEWTELLNNVIRKVIHDNNGLTGKALRKKVNASYPLDKKDGQPYKDWQKCVEHYLGPGDRKNTNSQPIPDKWWDEPILPQQAKDPNWRPEND